MKWIWMVGVIVFFTVLFNGFVGDDTGYINHPYIQKFQLSKLVVGSSSDLGGSSPITGKFYRPVMLLSLSVIYQLFHQQAWGYHLVQVTLFIINSYLVYFLYRKFFGKRLSLFLALIFLVHPINAETGLYISNLQDVMMMNFGLIGLLSPIGHIGLIWLGLSMLAKETGVLFVIIALALKKINWKQALGVVGVYGLIRAMAGVGFGSIQRIAEFSPEIVWYYIKTFLWPAKLAVGQSWIPQNDWIRTIIFIIFIMVITVILRKKKEYWLWVGWIVLGLLPHLQIIPLEMTVADRWAYFMSIGLIGLVGQMGLIRKGWIWWMIIMILGIRTIIRVQDFRDYEKLLTHDSKITDSYLLEQALGYVKNSREHTQKSIDLYPNPVNTNTMGYLYFREGNPEEAKRWWRKSISMGDNFQAYNNLVRVLLGEEKWDEAEEIISMGKSKFPQSPIWKYFENYILEYRHE